MRMAQLFLSNVLMLSSAAYADLEYNLPHGVTPVSHDIYDLHMTIFKICVVIGIVVFGIMFYAIIFHRKSTGNKAAHFHEHRWLEITWTIIPFLILVGMAVPATQVLIHMSDTDQPDLTIKITGYQWKWRYEYLDQGVNFFSNLSTPLDQLRSQKPKNPYYLREVDHPLIVPIHKKIRFLVTSNDVIHSWWVPELGVKRDAVPGFITEGWTRINRAGIYRGQCAELCGIHHGFMPIVVVAETEKEFDNWLAQQKGNTQSVVTTLSSTTTKPLASATTVAQKTPLVTATTSPTQSAVPENTKILTSDDLMKQGEQIFLNTCSVCHQPDGKGMPPTFPALKGSKIAIGPKDQHIQTVLFGRPGTAMQAFKDQLSDNDLAAVITYERNAFGNNMKDSIQPSDIAAIKQKGKI